MTTPVGGSDTCYQVRTVGLRCLVIGELLDLVGLFAAGVSLASISAAALLECEDENISLLGKCSSLPQDSDFRVNYVSSSSSGGTFVALVFLTSRMTGLPASLI